MPALWERDAVLAAVERTMRSALAGHGSTLFIAGDAGLGKTTVVEHARDSAGGDLGFSIGLGRGDVAEAVLPFGVIDQALDGLVPTRKLGEALSPAIPLADARAARFYGALSLLRRGGAATLLLFDDLHWADSDSLDLLSFLCRRIATLPVAVIAAMRPWPPAALELSQRLVQAGSAVLERLAPLSDRAAEALLEERSSRPLTRQAFEEASSLCEGNPLLLEQVALGIRAGKSVAQIAREYGGGREASLLLVRFAGVDNATLQFAQSASLFPGGFRPEIAAEVAGLSSSEGDRALQALCQAGILRSTPDSRAEFTHPLFRQVLYDQIPQPVRVRRHAAAFRVLMSHRAELQETSEQALRADILGDPEAVYVLQTVGDLALQAGGIATARDRYQAAVDAAGSSASPRLLLSLAETLLQSAASDEAIRVCRRLENMEGLTPDDRVHARRLLGRALFVGGDAGRAERELHAAAEEALRDEVPQAVDALLEAVFVAWPTGGPARATPLAAWAREEAARADVATRRRAETAWAFCTLIRGDPEGFDVIADAARHAEADPMSDLSDFAWSWGTLGTYGNMAKWTERFEDADRVFTVGMRTAEARGLPVAIASLCVMQADLCVRTGRLREALQLADRATSMAELAPERCFWAAIAHTYGLIELGRLGEAATWATTSRSLASREQDWPGFMWLWHVESQLDLHSRRIDEACAGFERIETLSEKVQIKEPCVVPWAGDAISAYAAAGRLADAMRVLEKLEAAVAPLPCRTPRIVASMARAVGLARQGQHDAAEPLFEQALSLCADVPLPLLEARVRLRYGGTLRRAGELRRARPLLARALELAEAAGAAGLADRARDELSAAGGRRRRRRENPDELTVQESRVDALLAEGLSNRQIADRLYVSVDTVETHVQHIFQKKGISSRRELMLQAPRGGL
jgi:DNA-binding CsgD family transcriptional regulator